MSSTDIHCGERKEENHDSGLIFGDDTSESADDRRNYWKENDHSTISKVCHDIFNEAVVGIFKKCLFSSNSTFVISKKQTEFLLKNGREPAIK